MNSGSVSPDPLLFLLGGFRSEPGLGNDTSGAAPARRPGLGTVAALGLGLPDERDDVPPTATRNRLSRFWRF